ncbi:MAG: methyl-accepting chemotaxis protein [Panacagrimonas sp.]|jgi:twitching motility protein PilJ|nr:methyl-accepting chemotaxis protein [Panacagrimonas sp.]MCC2656577.1 methyl-accepting chemotaxis protein [Panacagrimonas sp.]
MAKGRKVGFRFDILLLIIAVLGIAVGGGGLYYNDTLAKRHAAWITMARQIQSDALAVNRIAEDVGRGLSPNFAELTGQSENFTDSIRILRNGNDDTGIEPMPSAVREEVNGVEQAWATLKQSLDKLAAAEEAVGKAASAIRQLEDGGAKLSPAYRDAAPRLAAAASFDKLQTAGEQMGRTERLRVLARRLLGDGRDAGAIAAQIGTEGKALAAAHASLTGEGPVGSVLAEHNAQVAAMSEAAAALAAAGPALNDMQIAAAVVPGEGRNLYSTAITLEDGLGPLAGSGGFLRVAILPALGVAVVSLLLYVLLNYLAVRRRIKRSDAERDRQQQAILSLLDEIQDLSDGDLTVRANVTGEFTGTIADSINQTVDTLRSLVGTINETVGEISAAVASTQETATMMLSGSESQAQEVVEISGRMKQSTDSLNTVAARAEQLSQQASNSVQVAHNGASTVGRTIQGMAALREQIQDTAKRIKRLGESSQEIGTIIEFINDIAEQTNTLALNASIQAAMAGESGRGFAVVADEVQRLAERAAAATRQIETLVKTIQADTNEAIVSMERSTTNVIAGARSAEEAGQALTKIEATSNDLARLIQEISGEARSEAAQATRIAGQVQSIREIAFSTAGSAQKTAEAIGELNTLSSKLRQSVSGFKLPPDVSLETGP